MRRASILLPLSLVAVTACGGGDDTASTPSGAAGSAQGGASRGGASGAGSAGVAGKSGAAGSAGKAAAGSAGSSAKAGSGGASAGAGGNSGSAGTSGGAGGGAGSAGAGGVAGSAGAGGSAGSAGAGGAPGACSPGCTAGFVCDTQTATCVTEPPPPFITFPISGDRVSGLPELRWVAAPGASTADARVELCADEACATVLEALTGVGSATPAAPLPRASVFVRAFGRVPRGDGTFIEGGTPSPLRVVSSSGQPSTSRAPVGLVPDVDRDGHADLGVGTASSNESQIAVWLSSTGKTSRVDGPSESPNGMSWGGFGKQLVLASDVDGDGYPELATIDREVPSGGPVTIVRLELDRDTKKVVERQRFDVTLPLVQFFRQLAPLGDVDGDGYADLAVVSELPPVLVSGPGGGTLSYQTGIEILTLFGSSAGWSRTAKTQILVAEAERTFHQTPMPVRGVGDVDGDGVPDLAVGLQTSNPDSCLPARRGRVEIRRGSAAATFDSVLATMTDWFDPAPLGDVDGDGHADVGVTREPRETREPIPPSTSCGGSYTRTGFLPGEVRVFHGAAAGPLTEGAYTMPVEVVPGCTNGFAYGPSFLVDGRLVGGGDLDGDGLDDVALVSTESHPGGASGCSSGGPRVRVLAGAATSTLSLGQELSTPGAGYTSYSDRVAVVGDVDATARSVMWVLGAGKADQYAGPLGALAPQKQVTVTNFGRTILRGL